MKLDNIEKLILIQAGPNDVNAIRSLTRQAYSKWVPVIERELLPTTADYAEAIKKHRFDLLYRNSELVALVETVSGQDYLLIENIAVSPLFQGRGFGRKLVSHAEKIAASLGHLKIKLYTNKLFAENIRFYRRLGYRIDREQEFKGGTAVHMSKLVEV